MQADQKTAVETWLLEPRDPLVVGNGAQVPALAPRHAFTLPPPATAAGFVRARFVADRGHVDAETAAALLDVRIRGPWFADRVEPEEDDGAAGEPRSEPRLWWPVPADAAVFRPEHRGQEAHFEHGQLVTLGPGDGVSWPRSLSTGMDLVYLRSRRDGTKSSPPAFPCWPWETVVAWALGQKPGSGSEAARLELRAGEPGRLRPPIRREYRTHVALDDDSGTAEPEALFSSTGLRFAGGCGLVLEVDDRRQFRNPTVAASAERLGVLGAESRVSRVTVEPGGCFPGFGEVEERYRARIAGVVESGEELGLRLQLLAPAWFPESPGDRDVEAGALGGPAAWRPPTRAFGPILEPGSGGPSEPPSLRAPSLRAMCMDRYLAVSGWSLQPLGKVSRSGGTPGGAPRAVRRLVPAGTVYFYGGGAAARGESLLELCRSLWGRSLCAGLPGDPDSFLAPPAHDGYGLVLPAPCSLATQKMEEL